MTTGHAANRLIWRDRPAELCGAVFFAEASGNRFPPLGRGKQSACPTLSDSAPPDDRRSGRKPGPTFRAARGPKAEEGKTAPVWPCEGPCASVARGAESLPLPAGVGRIWAADPPAQRLPVFLPGRFLGDGKYSSRLWICQGLKMRLYE